MIRAWRSFWHRSWAPILFGAVFASLMVYFAMMGRDAGLNLWANLVSGLSESTVITGPLAAGVCAWEAARWKGPAAARLVVASRPIWQIRLRHAAESSGPIVLAFPAALLVLAGYGVATGTYGAPFVPWLLALWACLILAASFGYAVGIVLGSRWYTAPLAVLSFFGLYVGIQSWNLPFGVRSLFPVITNLDTEFVRYIPATMWGQIALFGALSLLLLILANPVRGGRRTGTMVACTAAAAAAFAGGAVVISTNGQYVTGYNSRDFVCEGTAPDICLNRGYAEAYPQLAQRFALLNEKVAGTSLVATRLEQNIEGIGDAPAAGARSVYLEEVNDEGMDFSVFRYVNKYGDGPTCWSEDEPAYDQYLAGMLVDLWLTEYDAYGFAEYDELTPGYAELQRMQQLSVAEGNAWLRQHERAYLDCTLTLSDLP